MFRLFRKHLVRSELTQFLEVIDSKRAQVAYPSEDDCSATFRIVPKGAGGQSPRGATGIPGEISGSHGNILRQRQTVQHCILSFRHVRYERNKIPQNPYLDHADDGTTLVAHQLCIAAPDYHHNAAAAIHPGRLVRDDRNHVVQIVHAAIIHARH